MPTKLCLGVPVRVSNLSQLLFLGGGTTNNEMFGVFLFSCGHMEVL